MAGTVFTVMTRPPSLLSLRHISSAIHQGSAANQIKVERIGSAINAYANGQLLASVADGTYTGSLYIGLVVFSYNQPNVDIRFDNFTVYSSSCPGSAAALSVAVELLNCRLSDFSISNALEKPIQNSSGKAGDRMPARGTPSGW